MWLYGADDGMSPDATEAVTYWIPEHRLSELRAKLDKLVSKAARLDVGAIVYAIGEPVARAFVRHETEEGYSYSAYNPNEPRAKPVDPRDIVYFNFYPVSVTGTTPRIAGWTFVATLQHLTDDQNHTVNLLRVTPGFTERLPDKYRSADASNCDHCCRTIRTRKDTYILRNDETGQYMQVGRNCTQDFLGGKDPHEVAKFLEYLFAALSTASENEEGGFGGGGREESYPISVFLTQTAAVVRMFGWMSRGKARDNPSLKATADIVLEVLGPPPFGADARQRWRELVDQTKPADADKELAETALEYARETLGNKEDRDDYEHNLYVALTQPLITRRLAGITASLIPYYTREFARLAERQTAVESQYVGEVGKREDFYVKLLKLIPLEGGQYGPTYLHRFITNEGAIMTWFASSEQGLELGKEYRISATVKKHEEYKGVKGTVITRATVYTDEGRQQAEEKEAKRVEREAKKAVKAAKLAAKAAAAAAKGEPPSGWGAFGDFGAQYIGQCDRVRRMSADNEARWHAMMDRAERVPFGVFLDHVDLTPILDDDVTPEDFVTEARREDPTTGAYRSWWGPQPAWFFQVAGFEYIFVD